MSQCTNVNFSYKCVIQYFALEMLKVNATLKLIHNYSSRLTRRKTSSGQEIPSKAEQKNSTCIYTTLNKRSSAIPGPGLFPGRARFPARRCPFTLLPIFEHSGPPTPWSFRPAASARPSGAAGLRGLRGAATGEEAAVRGRARVCGENSAP